MTVPYTSTGKPTSEEAIFTVRTFAEIPGMNCLPTSSSEEAIFTERASALVYLIGPMGAAVEEKKKTLEIKLMHFTFDIESQYSSTHAGSGRS